MKSVRRPTPAPPAGSPARSAPGLDDPINILIVDDEPKNLVVLESILDDPGYRLVRALSADQALSALISEDFALIVLDIRLPDMTGFELAQMVRARKKTAALPIIFLTAYYNEDQHMMDGYALGAADFLHKPVNRGILRSKVATFAELHRSHRALSAEVAERRLAQDQLRQMNATLEQRVLEQTEALRESDAQLRAMIDALPAAVYATDAEGRLTHYNQATVTLSGHTPILGSDNWFETWKLCLPDGTPLPRERCPMDIALTEGRVVNGMQVIVERADGQRVWVAPYPTPLRDSTGRIIGGINMLVDITDAKRSEAELEAARRSAEQANAAKSEFLANMSHEIRTPMNAIFGFTQLLSETVEKPKERDWVQSIKKSGQLLLNIINDVLDLSKIEAGKLELHEQPSDVSGIVDDIVVMFTPQASEKGIGLAREIDTAAVEPLLLDGHRLRQVLMNLVGNAVKYTERGSVTIQLQVVPAEAGGVARDVHLNVIDTGVGIPADQIRQIFEPFHQADSPDGKRRQGTGLGLSIAMRLVRAMGGEISADSEPGKGTVFRVRLANVPATGLAPVAEVQEERIDFNAVPPLNILAVDDVPWNLQVIAGYLRDTHHVVHTAGDGAAGLAAARDLRPDVVLLDLRMPVMDGYEARDAMRAEPSLGETAIVAVTASSLQQEEVALRASFDGYIRKPYSPTQLFETLAMMAGRLGTRESEQVVTDAGLKDEPGFWNDALQAEWRALQRKELAEMRSSMRMRHLADYAQRLLDFSERAQYEGLRALASQLSAAVDEFDIRRTQETLERVARLPESFATA
ncbi:response regulator [Arenimonas sp.]|uniref:hybrid sensor histidine kinase/response regulator n=1 Tax=Arenimonas sp. TaxID=1872635 RepID=UPI0039E2C1F8